MNAKVVLLDLENNLPTAQLFRDIIEHFSTLYIFNGQGRFEFPLVDLTELASWISSGQVIVLDTLAAKEKEFEYAVVVGQLLALLEPETHVEVISVMDSSQMLVDMMLASGLSGHLIQLKRDLADTKAKNSLPSIDAILANPHLQQIKKYCDTLAKMSGKPNTVLKLKNSIVNILNIDADQTQHILGMLINLKLVKKQDDQISFRKKALKQWVQLDLNAVQQPLEPQLKLAKVDSLLAKLHTHSEQIFADVDSHIAAQNTPDDLFKNFEQIDPVQMEVIQKLNQLKSEKPKDIYELRDLLEQLFPKSDVRLLLKEMLDKGYIYWNGSAVIYSHEMFLN
ncbi:MAG: hypothetical protein H9855_09750 [Candidatus Acinetobacter avistercoris]|uniref:hypothetical protein n=1 Tax=Acinetobacter sp. KS-LM10 TaxID=3120518 RepID=UPI001FA3C1B1|nr:hypothetical protein [Candidatus Acinetobacter avistercoris]